MGISWAWQTQKQNFTVCASVNSINCVLTSHCSFTLLWLYHFIPFTSSEPLSFCTYWIPLYLALIAIFHFPQTIICSLSIPVSLYSNDNSITRFSCNMAPLFFFYLYHCSGLWASGGQKSCHTYLYSLVFSIKMELNKYLLTAWEN